MIRFRKESARLWSMPLYDFECIECLHLFEKEHPRGVENPPCPLCKGKTEKRISPPPIIFKGGGFYKTDRNFTSKKDVVDPQPVNTSQGATESHKDTIAETQKKEPAETKNGDKTTPVKTSTKD